jgi:hydroxypyruvate isomerase
VNRREFSQLAGGVLGSAALRAHAQTSQAPGASQRFSVMIWTLAKQGSFEQCLEMVAAAGYQGIELVGEFHKWSPEETQRMIARIHGLGLVVDSMSGVKTGFAVPGQTAEFLSQFQQHIMAAKELGCPQVILLSGNKDPGAAPNVQHQTSVDNLKRAADMASSHAIEILIEPIDVIENPSIYMFSVTEGFQIAREVGRSNVRVLYDFYHEQRGCGNLIEKLQNNFDLVGLVHIADVPGRLEPGTGEIDYLNIYRKLHELNFSRYIAMEYYPTGDPVKSLRNSRLAALQVMR